MPSASPSRSSRRRTEFVDFFRGASSLQASPSKPSKELFLSQSTHPPELTHPTSSTTLRKVATKIPFLGRSRKKSTASIRSGYISSDTNYGHQSSSAASAHSTDKKNRRLSQPVPSPPRPSSAHPPLPKTVVPQPRPSLGIKFAAHLGARSRKPASSAYTSSAKHVDGTVSDTVAISRSGRRTSLDSDSTTTSVHGRSTPRAGPTITVSLSPDNLDDYRDLFTLPRSKTPSQRISSTPASEYRDLFHDGASNVTLTQTTSVASPPKDRLTETMSEIARREARQLATGQISSSFPSRCTKKHLPNSQPSEADDSAAEVESTPSSPTTTHSRLSCLPRSARTLRLRSPSATTKERSQPPTIPLPPAPTTKPPLPPSTPSPIQPPPPCTSSTTNTSLDLKTRPRANTIGSLPPPQSSPSPVPPPFPIKQSSSLTVDKEYMFTKQHSNKENSDLDLMSTDQLKQALKVRNNQYNELEIRFLQATQAHSDEKTSLEKKIIALEFELSKKDKQIRGFGWVLSAHGLPQDPTFLIPPSPAATEDSFLSMNNSPSPTSSRRGSHLVPDGSYAAESNPPPGAESILYLRTLDAFSSHKDKARRHRILADVNPVPFRSSTLSSKVLGLDAPCAADHSPNGKRSSLYSINTSSTSSTSSLPPLSPNGPSATALSAIPETGAAPIDPTLATSTNHQSALEDWDERERRSSSRSSRSSRRISTPSLVSSPVTATAPSSAYSANLRRSRPPSIAQVLEKSTSMEDVMKLHPFAGTVSSVVTPLS